MAESRKGLSLTYKFTLIILILTLFPAILIAVSSLNTFFVVEDSFEDAAAQIETSAQTETDKTRAIVLNRTRHSITALLTDNLQSTRDEKIEKYSAILGSVSQESQLIATHVERNWDYLDESTYNPLFGGMVWAGPNNTQSTRSSRQSQIRKLSHIGVLLEEIDDANELTSLAYFGTRDNNVVTSRDITRVLEQIPTGFSNVDRPWYRSVSQTGETVWTNTYVDANTNELVTTVASPAYHDDKLLGVAGFDVTLGVLSSDILETDPGFAFLLDSSGEAIVYPGMKAPNKTVYAERTFEGTNFLEDDVSPELRSLAESMVAGEKGLKTVNIEGEKSFVAYGPLSENDWSVGVAVPVSETLQPINSIEADLDNRLGQLNAAIQTNTDAVQSSMDSAMNMTLYRYGILFVLIVVIIIGLGAYVSTRITQPLLELHEKADSISKGGIGKEVEIHTGDEIEDLADSFNRIIRTIKILQKRDAPREKYVTDQYNE